MATGMVQWLRDWRATRERRRLRRLTDAYQDAGGVPEKLPTRRKAAGRAAQKAIQRDRRRYVEWDDNGP
jgi:hypothetical protein